MSEETKTAYQYADDTGEYLGTYEVPVCGTTGEATLPQNMTFTPPPDDVDNGKVASWGGTKWVQIEDPHKIKRPPMPDSYAGLNEEFVQWMISEGLWTGDDEAKYQAEKEDWSQPAEGKLIEDTK